MHVAEQLHQPAAAGVLQRLQGVAQRTMWTRQRTMWTMWTRQRTMWTRQRTMWTRQQLMQLVSTVSALRALGCYQGCKQRRSGRPTA